MIPRRDWAKIERRLAELWDVLRRELTSRYTVIEKEREFACQVSEEYGAIVRTNDIHDIQIIMVDTCLGKEFYHNTAGFASNNGWTWGQDTMDVGWTWGQDTMDVADSVAWIVEVISWWHKKCLEIHPSLFGTHQARQQYLIAKLIQTDRCERFLELFNMIDMSKPYTPEIVAQIVFRQGGNIARVMKNMMAASEILG